MTQFTIIIEIITKYYRVCKNFVLHIFRVLLVLILAAIYSIVCYLKVTLFFREYKSFALKNKRKLYLSGISLPFSLIIGGIMQIEFIYSINSFYLVSGDFVWQYVAIEFFTRILPSILSLSCLVFGWIRYNQFKRNIKAGLERAEGIYGSSMQKANWDAHIFEPP